MAIQNQSCIKKHLRQKIATYLANLFPVDPYQKHLEMLISFYLVPYTSVDNLFAHRIDARVVRQIHLLMAIVFLNLFRLTAIVIYPTPAVRYYFVQYFSGQANSWYFHLMLLVSFVGPSFLYVNFYLITSRSESPYRVFDIYEAIIKRKEYHLSADRARRLDFGMRLFPAMSQIMHPLMRFLLITLPMVDMYLNFGNFKLVHLLLFPVWNLILCASITVFVSVGVLLAQQTYLINFYYLHRLLYLREKLSKALDLLPTTGKLSVSLIEGYFVRRWVRSKAAVFRLQKYLTELTTLSAAFLQQNGQFKYMPAVAYYTLCGVIEMDLYLALSRPTKTILRIIAIVSSVVVVFFYFLIFLLMSEMNSRSKSLLPAVNCCLFQDCNFPKKWLKVPTQKLTLAETQHFIGADKFAMSLGGILCMTRLQLLHSCATIVQNVLLIIDLNDYQ